MNNSSQDHAFCDDVRDENQLGDASLEMVVGGGGSLSGYAANRAAGATFAEALYYQLVLK